MGVLQRHRLHGSRYMDADEIDSILRLQWKSLHGSSPYQEDYYFQVLSVTYGNVVKMNIQSLG